MNVEDVLNRFAEAMSRLLIEQHQRHLAALDLTMLQAQVLRILRREGAVAKCRLAAELNMSAPAVTQLTDRLRRKGLIELRPSEGDRRSVLVALSESGQGQIDEFRERRGAVFADALAGLDAGEQERIVATLGRVVEVLEGYEHELQHGRAPAESSLNEPTSDRQ